MEGKPQNLDMEVNGVASQTAFWPAPVTVFDDEAWERGQNEIARSLFEQLESTLLEQRQERS